MSDETAKFNQEEEIIPEYKPTLVKVLNVVAFILIIVLIAVIYIPSSIWKEENRIRELGRQRMQIQYDVQKYYNQMAGTHQPDPVLAMKVVSAVRDSTRADSNFYGQKVIKLPDGKFNLEVPKNFYASFDTNFAFKYELSDTVIDTTIKITKWNPELMTIDTLYVISSMLEEVKTDPNFRSVIDTELTQRVANNTYYRRYYLTEDLAMRPLLDTPYTVLKTEKGIRVEDPLKTVIREPRYLFFTFVDSTHGYIENGEPSWK
ncbi:MAG TPA: hypothetical protein P5028_01040 [Candidatus Marinimicrobia bacterium]|nr:hypothetical protein [Candidatus Neomarinimicrobiota bacterium]